MASIEEEFNSFSKFVTERIRRGIAEPSLDQLYDLWRLENPSDDVLAEDIAAIAASIEDFKQGDRGSLLGLDSKELRSEFDLNTEPFGDFLPGELDKLIAQGEESLLHEESSDAAEVLAFLRQRIRDSSS